MSAPRTETVSILPIYRDEAEARLEKLARRAARYGQTITWSMVERVETFKRTGFDGRPEKVARVILDVTVEGESPKCGDFVFLAMLERVEGGVLISGKAEIGDLGRAWDGRCEHCGSKRDRRVAFVVEGEGGRKIVGKSCLKDHVGTATPAGLLWIFQFLREFPGDQEFSGWGGGRWQDETLGVIAAARAAIALWGWAPNRPHERSTAMDVSTLNMTGKISNFDKERRRLLETELKERGKHYRETAQAVIDWAKALTPKNDYESNLRVACSGDYVGQKTWGLVISAAAAYDRQVARESEREAAKAKAKADGAKSYHFGKVGERVKGVAVEIVRKVQLPDYGFGPSSILIMREEGGALLSWKTGSLPRVAGKPLEVGERYRVDMTPKAHVSFNEIPETRVSRCKVEAAQ